MNLRMRHWYAYLAGIFIFSGIACGPQGHRAQDSLSSETALLIENLATHEQNVVSFTLINADNDQPIATFDPIQNGTTINLAVLPTTRLNIRANTSPSAVGSVRITLNGRAVIENAAPYAYFGDTNGDYYPGSLTVQTYSLSATPYSSSNASGTMGGTLSIQFNVVNENESVTAPAAAASLAINSGGGAITSGSGLAFMGDQYFVGGKTYSTSASITGTTDAKLYQTERWGAFSYNVGVPNGTYNVTLKFAEIYFNSSGRRVFSVTAEGVQIISNLDIFAKVGLNSAYDVTVPVAVSDGVLNLSFIPVIENPKVSAIVITAADGAQSAPIESAPPASLETPAPAPTPAPTPIATPAPTPAPKPTGTPAPVVGLRDEAAIHAKDFATLEALFPASAATIAASQSGNWSDANIWNLKRLPTVSDRVRIPSGLVVTVDTLGAVASWVRLEGTLRFARDRSSRLTAETVYASMGHNHSTMETTPSRIEMGTQSQPIPLPYRAEIVIKSNGQAINHAWDPFELSRGLLSMGFLETHGAAKTSWVATVINQEYPAGSKVLNLKTAPSGWQVGDTIVISGALYGQDETRTIAAISGSQLTLSSALVYARTFPRQPGGGMYPSSLGLSFHIANLTRNVEIRSDSQYAGNRFHQGHVMLMHGGHKIRYTHFRDLGRTTIDPVTDPFIRSDGSRDPSLTPDCGMSFENVRGRYALHFHMNAQPWTKSIVEGNALSVQREKRFKFGFINHSSNVDFIRNVSHQVDGSHFMLEEGDEIGTFTENLAIYSKGSNLANNDQPRNICLQNHSDPNYQAILYRRRQDMGHNGSGFWFQGGGVTSLRNVAVGNSRAAYDLVSQDISSRDTFKVKFPVANFPPHLLENGNSWAKGRAYLDVDQVPVFSDGDMGYAGGPTGRRHDHGLAFFLYNHMLHQAEDYPLSPKTRIQNFVGWNLRSGVMSQYLGWSHFKNVILIASQNTSAIPYNHSVSIQTANQGGRHHIVENSVLNGFDLLSSGVCYKLGDFSEAINLQCMPR